MDLYTVSFPLLIFCYLITFTNGSGSHNPTNAAGDPSVNCGSTGKFTALDGREWIGDVTNQKSTSSLQIKGSSEISAPNKKLIPHGTARFSRSQFSYTFRVGPGPNTLRLHFNRAQFKGSKRSKDLFTVQAGHFTLLGNFSASLTSAALGVKSLTKEFCLNIEENKQFTLTFIPETSQSRDAYAFINGIGILSVPAIASYFQGAPADIEVQVVGEKSMVYVDHHTALELIHRSTIKPSRSRDFVEPLPFGAFRKAKRMKNETWRVAVDVGFRYLIRLQFSEIGLKISATRDAKCQVLINGMIANTNNIQWYYKDYLVTVRGLKEEGKRDLSISLLSHGEVVDGLHLLSGFEIFKLSKHDNSLASPNPLPPHRHAFSFVATIVLIGLLTITVHKILGYSKAKPTEAPEKNNPPASTEHLCCLFSLEEIRSATRNFDDGLVIGKGGFGKVYKGRIDRGKTRFVAVKRLKPFSGQGACEFHMEIKTLSKIRHMNLVSLIGYCDEESEMILVYDYMPGGTLSSHLYKYQRMGNDCPLLNWKQRLNICIGAGRGLDYLHTSHGVIHRDVKSSNILLDENFVAKVSDFGLAKHEEKDKAQSHISTQVKGTKGYMDPHYFNTNTLTRNADTYAFGVVLFQTLCGRPAVDSSVTEDERVLTMWARNKIRDGEVDGIVDPSLSEEISKTSLRTFVEIAVSCLREDPRSRPTMSQVVQQLEVALNQQENEQDSVSNDITSAIEDIPSSSGHMPTSPLKTQSIGLEIRDQNKNTSHKQSQGRAIRNDLLLGMKEAKLRLRKFDWDTIEVSTYVFAVNKIVGHGSFGHVYKGTLTTGDIVAVKMFSPYSTQAQSEYEYKMRLLPRLQHRNIIKLLGYCCHKEAKLLVYEFMENISLDTFICEKRRRRLLTWPVLFEIMKGIAQGVIFLHQKSVVHINLGTHNILLDGKMTPKISGFAYARAKEGIDVEMKLPGMDVYGCMCPEYAKCGKISFKTDVFSFGIIVLQVLTRRLDHVWELWKEGKALEVVDKSLDGAFEAEEALRCIQVGLLCVEEQPQDRPTMPSVLQMLDGCEPLITPKQPWLLLGEKLFSVGATSGCD